ncbi:gluconeogenesis factor YvcK family protein [Plantactinospora sp. CA-290183]|uniref:gluconeogenesis factor YvcK family protein n=1 Tax=Plantactinospora sp. CA-290183 TaxID=3240006 RepID=UPI003D8FC6D2
MPGSGVAGGRPRVVVLGGGRGLTATVRAVRAYAGRTTAVVATADDSGSTGRLRSSMAIPAPGDVRRCMIAMAGLEDLPLGRAFEHRFAGTDVEGHALGNLLLAGMTAVTSHFLGAIDEVSRLLGLDPEVAATLPATVNPVDLSATTVGGTEVFGQYAVSKTPGIARVWLHPPDVHAPERVVAAILDADQIVLGPGSLYTSILAAALVPDIHLALAEAQAREVYVCNLEPEDAETLGYDVAAHVAALVAHGVEPDVVLVSRDCALPLGDVKIDVVQASLAAPDGTAHDSDKLAVALTDLLP